MVHEEIIPPTPEWVKQNAGMVELVMDDSGNIKYAKKRDTRIINYLIEREILDQTHAHYALVFEDMRNCFRRKLSNYRNTIYAAEFFGGDISNGVFETMFLRVCRRIIGTPEHCIKFAIDSESTENNRSMAWECRHRIQDAFDLLVRSIDEVRKEFEKA